MEIQMDTTATIGAETVTIDDWRMYEAISIALQFQTNAPRLLELLESMAGPGAREYLADMRQAEPFTF